MCGIVSRIQHVLGWRIRDVKPSEAETTRLNAAEVPDNDVYRSYILWRMWMLLAAIPSMAFSTIASLASIRSIFTEETELNILGKLAELMTVLSPLSLTLAAIASLMCWRRKGRSTWFLLVGWIVSMILPLWPALVPAHLIVGSSVREFDSRIAIGLQYSIQILPLIITFPGGAVRGGLRIRGLLPESALAGWIIVVGAPFHSLIMIMALVFIVQVFGNWILVAGAFMLVFVPFIYIFRRKLYTQALTEEHEHQLDRTQCIAGWVSLVGSGLVLAWAFTVEVEGYKLIGPSEDDKALLPYTTGVRMVFEGVGRMFVTTLCYADIILNMTLANWRADLHRHADGGNINVMDGLQQAFLKGAANEIELPPVEESFRQDAEHARPLAD